MHGRNGKDLYIHGHAGSRIKNNASGEILADLVKGSNIVLAAGGGPRGRGNIQFKTSTRQRQGL
jgi:GTP-binding protein